MANQSETGECYSMSRVSLKDCDISSLQPVCSLWLFHHLYLILCSRAGHGNGKYCCPKIYFNHRCFSGPYLNKGRIAELPQFIGPGNCVLVLKEVRGASPDVYCMNSIKKSGIIPQSLNTNMEVGLPVLDGLS